MAGRPKPGSDRGEPVHVHVERDRKTAKFWLGPVRLEHNHGFAPTELNTLAALAREHETELVKAWHGPPRLRPHVRLINWFGHLNMTAFTWARQRDVIQDG